MCYFENGEEYKSDVYRRIQKFDIFYCDLGAIDDVASGTLGKERPCVIVSSDELSHPKAGQYIIAPIRTEHNLNVYKETLESIVTSKKKVGRVYVPIEMAPDDYRFIDITQIRQITIGKIKNYVSTIGNSELKNRINNELFNTLFSPGELKLNKSDIPSASSVQKPVQITPKTTKDAVKAVAASTKVETLQKPEVDSEIARKIGFALAEVKEPKKDNNAVFIELYNKIQKGSLTRYEASTKMGVSITAFNNLVKEYEEKNGIKTSITPPIKPEKPIRGSLPTGFSKYVQLYDNGKMTASEIAERIGKSTATVYNYINRYKGK